MGQTFQEMLAGRISPAGGRSRRRQERLGGVPQGAWRASLVAVEVANRPPGARERGARRRAPGARARAGRAAAGGVPVPGARVLFYLLFAFAPLLYTAWLSFFDWDGLTVGTWVGLDNYNDGAERPGHPRVVRPLARADLLLRDPAGRPRPGARVADRAQPRPRGRRSSAPCCSCRRRSRPSSSRIAWVWIYAPSGPLNEALRAIGLGSHRARLARRLHVRAAGARPGRHVGDVRPVHRAVHRRHPEDPAHAVRGRARRRRGRACASSSP